MNNIFEMRKNLLNLSLNAKTNSELMRTFSWKIYLNILSTNANTTLRTWLDETLAQRQAFKKLVNDSLGITQFKGDPLGGLTVEKGTLGWHNFFDKADLKHLIKIDIDRTFQDRDLFCENIIKDIEYNILYIFAKGNEPTSYKQGMNDILAMIIYSFYPYYTKSNIKNYTSELFDKWTKDPLNNLKDIYCFFHDETEFESDLYYVMLNLMKAGVNKFYEDVDDKKKTGQVTTYLVKRCHNIAEKKIKLQNSRLYYHFSNIGLDSGIILQRWIKCLFTREFHPQDCSIIWDAILANEVIEPSGELLYIDYFSVAMMDFISDELLNKDQSECFKRLFSYPPLESMETLLSLTETIKPTLIQLGKNEEIKQMQWNQKIEENKQQLEKLAQQNQKLRKGIEQNENLKNQNIFGNNINNFLFTNTLQMNNNNINNQILLNNPLQQNLLLQQQLPQLQNQLLLANNLQYLQNLNNNNLNLINNNLNNLNLVNNNLNNLNSVNNNMSMKSPLDQIKKSYTESNNETLLIFNEIKNIMNKYKYIYSNDDRIKLDQLFQSMEQKF